MINLLLVKRMGDQIRFEFVATAGRTYTLEARDELISSAWADTGQTFQATANGRAFFEIDAGSGSQFFRVRVE